MSVNTWADAYGVWHARVSATCVSPLIAARRAIRDELTQRESNVNRACWLYLARVPDQDTIGTMVYREGVAS